MTEVAENDVKLAEKGSENPAVQTQNQNTVIFEMAQQSVVNGPSIDGSHLKNEINSQESQQNKVSPEPTSNSPLPQSPGPFLTRPPLNRVDSRQNFQYRPPFPNTNQPSGPQSIGPQSLGGYQPNNPVNSGPQSISPQVLGGQQVRPQQGVRQPVVSPQFVQRGPPSGPGGTQSPRPVQSVSSAPGGPFPQNPQQRPAFRPQTPYPRPPLLGQRPNIFQQSSVPAFNRPRPTLEETVSRSLTLDSSELENQRNVEAIRTYSPEQRPPSAASLGRSFSVTTSNPSLEQKKINGSQESLNISRQSSLENVYKKEENVPSRPESRSASRMDKIIENDDKLQNKSRPESRGSEVTNGDIITSRSPSKESPDHQNHNVTLNSPKRPESADSDVKKKDLDLKLATKSNKGDNDSGVDESTQGNDQSCNGDPRSPRKPAKSRISSTTPTTARSSSRGSKTPSSLQSPDSAATTPGSADKKKVPMNKVQVGSAPSPNLKVVRSKIGSLDNAHYKPGGGKVKIESKKLDFKNAGSRIEAKNEKYTPKVGEKKDVEAPQNVISNPSPRKEIYSARRMESNVTPRKELNSARSVKSSTSPRKVLSQKLEWNAKSKIGSLENAAYKPKGSDKKIESVKLDFKDKAKPKIGSKDNIKHQPGGGDVKIENRKLELQATSKVGSLDNVKHKPTGGDKKIFDDKDYLKNKSGKASMDHSLSGSQHSVQSHEPKAPVADENLNQEH